MLFLRFTFTYSFSFSEISSGCVRTDPYVKAADDWATRKWKQPSDEHDAFLTVTDRLWDIRAPGTKHFQFTKNTAFFGKVPSSWDVAVWQGLINYFLWQMCKNGFPYKGVVLWFWWMKPSAQRWAVPDALITRSIAPHIKLLKRGLSLFILF